ncbi:myrosinase-binding protein 2-like isoform X2 [Ipomoea triloba]|uniref:myrosinase-binding protein 2-like isoform X2 n=1 Tax=Ipomoea triloba TaxID=35885 RepID=UPI00125CEF4C|nr:myrosinase-binding protein 2-like isoform X2 [Ipomoea triloba]
METKIIDSKIFKIDLMPSHHSDAVWDECDLGEVVGILISYNTSNIASLCFFYAKNNVFQMPTQHGRLEGSSRMILLDYPTEILTSVHGYRNAKNVTSITFVTNKAKYGPFGKVYSNNWSTNDDSFDLQLESKVGLISGFHGQVELEYV